MPADDLAGLEALALVEGANVDEFELGIGIRVGWAIVAWLVLCWSAPGQQPWNLMLSPVNQYLLLEHEIVGVKYQDCE
jgi:hypothetical protein